MALDALTPELKLNIIEQLDPDSTLNFALTCKNNATLSASSLREHKRLLAEWRVLDTQNAQILLWQTLKEVLDDPSKGWYVRELNLPPSRQYNWNAGESLHPQHPQSSVVPSDNDKEVFKKAARSGKLETLYPGLESGVMRGDSGYDFTRSPNDLTGTLEDRIDAGFEDAIIIILLHYLPHLTTIRITDTFTDCLELFMRRLSSAYKDPELVLRLPLQHLKTAAIAHYDTEMSCDADWAFHFLGIPSLRTFAADHMGDAPDSLVRDAYLSKGTARHSNVTELFFNECGFELESLGTLLAGIKDLKKFTYSDGGSIVSDSLYEPKKVIQMLASNVGHSLEELRLDQDIHDAQCQHDEAETNPKKISLHDFKLLKVLDCPWHMIRPEIGDDEDGEDMEPLEEGFHHEEDDNEDPVTDFDVRSILPPSIQELHLYGPFDGKQSDIQGSYDEWLQLGSVFSAPSAATPHLSEDSVCLSRCWNDGMHDEIVGRAEQSPWLLRGHPLAWLFDRHGYR